MIVHGVFDLLALVVAVITFLLLPAVGAHDAVGVGVSAGAQRPWRIHPLYFTAASLGAMAGAYLFGTWNLRLTGVGGLARSVEGGLAGGVVAIELLKARVGIQGSTGVRLAAPLAAAIAAGRIGCFLSGRADFTYGTATALPWGVDFGDGVRRHPVQLYEAAVMVLLLGVFLVLRNKRHRLATRDAFYLFIGVYAGQRFIWEFFKPYGPLIGPFNVFHLLSVLLLTYAILYPCAPHVRTYFSARRRQCARRA